MKTISDLKNSKQLKKEYDISSFMTVKEYKSKPIGTVKQVENELYDADGKKVGEIKQCKISTKLLFWFLMFLSFILISILIWMEII